MAGPRRRRARPEIVNGISRSAGRRPAKIGHAHLRARSIMRRSMAATLGLARVRVGRSPTQDQTFGNWEGPFAMSPGAFDLAGGDYLQAELTFGSDSNATSPKVRALTVC